MFLVLHFGYGGKTCGFFGLYLIQTAFFMVLHVCSTCYCSCLVIGMHYYSTVPLWLGYKSKVNLGYHVCGRLILYDSAQYLWELTVLVKIILYAVTLDRYNGIVLECTVQSERMDLIICSGWQTTDISDGGPMLKDGKKGTWWEVTSVGWWRKTWMTMHACTADNWRRWCWFSLERKGHSE